MRKSFNAGSLSRKGCIYYVWKFLHWTHSLKAVGAIPIGRDELLVLRDLDSSSSTSERRNIYFDWEHGFISIDEVRGCSS